MEPHLSERINRLGNKSSSSVRSRRPETSTGARPGIVASRIQAFQLMEELARASPEHENPATQLQPQFTQSQISQLSAVNNEAQGTPSLPRGNTAEPISFPSRIPLRTTKPPNVVSSLAAFGKRQTQKFQALAARRTSRPHEHRSLPKSRNSLEVCQNVNERLRYPRELSYTNSSRSLATTRRIDAANFSAYDLSKGAARPGWRKSGLNKTSEGAMITVKPVISAGKSSHMSIRRSSESLHRALNRSAHLGFEVRQKTFEAKESNNSEPFRLTPASESMYGALEKGGESTKSGGTLTCAGHCLGASREDSLIQELSRSSATMFERDQGLDRTTEMLDQIVLEHSAALQEIASKLSQELSGLREEIESVHSYLLPEQCPRQHREIAARAIQLQRQSDHFAALISMVEEAATAWERDHSEQIFAQDRESQFERALAFSPPAIYMPTPLHPTSTLLKTQSQSPEETFHSVHEHAVTWPLLPTVQIPWSPSLPTKSHGSSTSFKSDPSIKARPWTLSGLSPLVDSGLTIQRKTIHCLVSSHTEGPGSNLQPVTNPNHRQVFESQRERRLRRCRLDHARERERGRDVAHSKQAHKSRERPVKA